MISLKGKIKRKDQAIIALVQIFIEKDIEHKKMSEIFTNFKNNLITEIWFYDEKLKKFSF
jgi:hypothetical protein